jgi:hypothetical protein
MQLAVSIGLYTMTDISDVQKKILEHLEFRQFKVEYDKLPDPLVNMKEKEAIQTARALLDEGETLSPF